MTDSLHMRGHYLIEARDASTGALLWERKIENMLMAINRDARVQMLTGEYAGDGTEFEIKYFAFGTGSTAPTADDTQLAAEVYRKQVTRISVDGGTVTSVVSLGAAEANYTLRELGVFCGPSASSAANSGLMISRVLIQIEKNTNIVINITRRDVCTI